MGPLRGGLLGETGGAGDTPEAHGQTMGFEL